MPILPDFVRILIGAYLEPVLHWVSEQIYTELLKRADDHFLLDLHATFDLTPLESACAAFHHAEGPGACPTHAVPHSVRTLLTGALHRMCRRALRLVPAPTRIPDPLPRSDQMVRRLSALRERP